VQKTLRDIAEFLGGRIIGKEDVIIENIRPLDKAGSSDITFIASRKHQKRLAETKAAAVIVNAPLPASGKNLLIVADPYAAFGKLMALYYPPNHGYEGISKDAVIEEGAVVSSGATVFPGVYIGRGAKIARGVVLYPGVFIGRDSVVGEDSLLYANVSVYHECIIGKRVILHSGVVVGSDGFGFAAPGAGNIKIPQTGFVQIDDDVEIGANTTIDRATISQEKTWIGRNVKIDNLVQIAHNIVIGENSIITAQVGIAGSTRLGKSVIIGGQAAIAGHINIGDYVMIAAGSGIHRDINSGQVVAGSPQLPHRQWLKVEACRNKLPEMRTTLAELKRKVELLQEQLNKKPK